MKIARETQIQTAAIARSVSPIVLWDGEGLARLHVLVAVHRE